MPANKLHRFYLVDEDGTVTYTNDFEVATAAKRDGSTLVIEPVVAEYTFDNDTQTIEEADPDNFLDPDEDEDEDEDEGDS